MAMVLSVQDQTIVVRVITDDEGGLQFTNCVNDPGGATFGGITQRRYAEWCAETHREPTNVRFLTADEVYAFYDDGFFGPQKIDLMPVQIRAAFFSAAINCEHEAPKILQRVLGVNDDGEIGPVTLAKLHNAMDQGYWLVVNAFVDEWVKHYMKLVVDNAKHWYDYAKCLDNNQDHITMPATLRSEYLIGWFNRANKYRVYR